jgi:hypothetical protein
MGRGSTRMAKDIEVDKLAKPRPETNAGQNETEVLKILRRNIRQR